jgi:hypothetical protein
MVSLWCVGAAWRKPSVPDHNLWARHRSTCAFAGLRPKRSGRASRNFLTRPSFRMRFWSASFSLLLSDGFHDWPSKLNWIYWLSQCHLAVTTPWWSAVVELSCHDNSVMIGHRGIAMPWQLCHDQPSWSCHAMTSPSRSAVVELSCHDNSVMIGHHGIAMPWQLRHERSSRNCHAMTTP